LMYRFMEWDAPKFVHLPLILKPTGQGKLSKRDGAKFGFPVFPMEWKAEGEETYAGFKEDGYDKEALKNFLALLGWNPGNDEEMLDEARMIELFDLDKIVKSGARFDKDKVKWFNQQYIIKKDNQEIAELIKPLIDEKGYSYPNDDFLLGFIDLMKERVESYNEFASKGYYFFESPSIEDEKTARKKWKDENRVHFENIMTGLNDLDSYDTGSVQSTIKNYIGENELSFGAILPILRIAVSGTMKGPDIFGMMALLGKDESISRLRKGVEDISALR